MSVAELKATLRKADVSFAVSACHVVVLRHKIARLHELSSSFAQPMTFESHFIAGQDCVEKHELVSVCLTCLNGCF